MKKSLLLLGAGVMLLTSCSNDELVNPVANTGKDLQPISFAAKRTNMSRTAGHRSGLETEYYDFGVWAYKSNSILDQSGIDYTGGQGPDVVMTDYLVGYWNGTDKGYEPTGGQNMFSSVWYYEGLGSADAKFTFKPGVQTTARTSANPNQYLKYWDLSKTYVNFYACAPYGSAYAFNAEDKIMTFNAIHEGDTKDVMYGCTSIASAVGADGVQVQIPFKRLSAQIRLAFFSDLKGYDVELIDFKDAGDGVLALAANWDGASTYTEPDGTTTGYVASAIPTVTFNTDGTGTVSYGSPTLSKSNITCSLAYFTPSHNYAQLDATALAGNAKWEANPTWDNYYLTTPLLGEGYANKIYTGLRRVIPHGSHTNCGFTVNVSFKLTAKDTKEVVYVYGAKVYVEPTYTQWEPNKLYTYVFRITNNLPGTTLTPQDPGVTPTPKALYPIVFNNATVEDIDFQEIEYPKAETGVEEDAFPM